MPQFFSGARPVEVDGQVAPEKLLDNGPLLHGGAVNR